MQPQPAAATAEAVPQAVRDEAARVRLASNPHTEPDLLQALAGDDLVTVRAAVALNPSAPAAVNRHLAADGDERVRALLARKLALFIPHVAARDRAQIREQAIATLSGMVEDGMAGADR